MLKIVKLGVELVVVSLVLAEFEELGFELGDDEILLVGFDLGRVEVLWEVRIWRGREEKSTFL